MLKFGYMQSATVSYVSYFELQATHVITWLHMDTSNSLQHVVCAQCGWQ